jgi:hypothetical protein
MEEYEQGVYVPPVHISQFLFVQTEVVLTILAPLLLLRRLAYTRGYVKNIKDSQENG